jgi:polyisoprenoid-binding protein YceI
MLRFVMMPRRVVPVGALAAAGLTLVLTACGSAANNPTPAPAAPPTAAQPAAQTDAPTATRSQSTSQATGQRTSQAAGQANASQPNQATAQPATATQQGQAAQPNQSTQVSAAAQAQVQQGASTRLVIDSAASKASYHAHEQLVGRSLPSEAVGSTSSVSGSLVLAADGSIVADQSTISVDVSKLQSDESRRDNFIKSSTLQTSRFPMATFVPREAQGLPSPLPTSGQATFQLVGDLTVHGVTRPATWQVTAQFGDGTVSGTATTSVNISDFGMSPPKAGPVLSIEDGLTLELASTAAREA